MTRLHITLVVITSALACALPRTLCAHHVVSDSGIAWVEPVSVVQLDVTSARFELGETWQGRWWSVAPMVEFAPWSRVSLMVRVPLIDIRFDDGRAVRGVGDLSSSVKALLWSDRHGKLIVSVGLGVELPTGSARDALGAGHVELVPFVTTSSQLSSRFILSTLWSERISLGDEDATTFGSPLAVHERHELFVRAMATWVSASDLGVYATLGADRVVVWQGDERGPLTARMELGHARAKRWRLAARLEAPRRGARRHELLTGLNLALWW